MAEHFRSMSEVLGSKLVPLSLKKEKERKRNVVASHNQNASKLPNFEVLWTWSHEILAIFTDHKLRIFQQAYLSFYDTKIIDLFQDTYLGLMVIAINLYFYEPWSFS